MKTPDFDTLTLDLRGRKVERPNRADNGTLSGHAAGEPFEKLVYRYLKNEHPGKIFKQYEYLNDLFLKNPLHITAEARKELFESHVAFFLLSRGDKALDNWNPNCIFEEKQNDTADILYHDKNCFDIIDVKTRNMSKNAQPPNIISAYKLAQACALMIDNNDFNSVAIHYVEIEWLEKSKYLECTNASWVNLFKSEPSLLYINWAAAMQIQFHVSELNQSFCGDMKEWSKAYIGHFVKSAETRCEMMCKKYIIPFRKYLQ